MIQTLFGSLDEPEKKSIFGRMKEAVSRTRETLADRIEDIVALTHEVDEAALEQLEMSLVASDLGIGTSTEIIDALRGRVKRHEIRNGAELKQLLKQEIQSILDAREEEDFFKPKYTAPGQNRSAGSCRHLSCRGHRAIGGVGPAHRRGDD
jgi:fused signal recognition particle receptor